MDDVCMRDIYTIQIHRTTNVHNTSPDCEVCTKGVIQLSSLQVRQFSQSGKLPNVCKVCNKEFLKVCRMQIRHLTQPESQLHICDICQKSFIHAGNLRKHKLQHENANQKSQESTDSKANTSASEAEKSTIESEEISDIKPEIGKCVYVCKQCGKQFRDELIFTRHCQVHSERQNFFCNVCKKSFDSRSAFRYHNRDEHEMNQQYICNICCTQFTEMNLLKDHCIEMHNNVHNNQLFSGKDILGRQIFRCEQCQKNFIQKVAYERHCQLHKGATPVYTCKICHKTYIQPGRLKFHQRMHKKTKFFSCNTCNHTFQQKSAYESHVETCGESDHES